MHPTITAPTSALVFLASHAFMKQLIVRMHGDLALVLALFVPLFVPTRWLFFGGGAFRFRDQNSHVIKFEALRKYEPLIAPPPLTVALGPE